MKAAGLAALSLAGLFAQSVSAKELRPDFAVSEYYDTGAVHEQLMAKKMESWSRQSSKGAYNSTKWGKPGRKRADPVRCKNGVAAVVPGDPLQTFQCNSIDFYDFLSHAELGSTTGEGSSSWGWTAPNGREFVVVAQADGAAFAEITSVGKLVYLGRLPQTPEAQPSIWREIRGYKNFILIGSEAEKHGVQIFDMSKLLKVDPKKPVVFTQQDLTGFWNDLPIGRSHNVVVNEEKQYGVAVGAAPRSSACRAGLIFFDLKDPTKPQSLGCAAGDGYVHDAQCLVYRGPDAKHYGKDICFGFNEDTLTIYDVSVKNATNIISRTTYEGASYTHQGWVTNADWIEFLLVDDELDEANGAGPGASGFPVTFFWDIRSLEAPKQTGYFRSKAKSIDHNQFVVNGRAYQSNYGAGLRVLDVSSLPRDPTGGRVKEVGFFDIYPEDDADPVVDFVGTWSHYPFFKSGFILINTIERGAFVVKFSGK